jgi:alpha-L-fucosidase
MFRRVPVSFLTLALVVATGVTAAGTGCASSSGGPSGTGGAGKGGAVSGGAPGSGGVLGSGGAANTGGAGPSTTGGAPGSGGSAGAADSGGAGVPASGGQTGGGSATATGGIGGRGGAGMAGGPGVGGGGAAARPLEDLQRAYVELRFGMFIHFGILTYTGAWAQGNLPITMFNPANLNPGQWADAAVAAKMKFGILTTKHHDGFALWPSAVGNFSVKNIPWRNGQGDVVREYVDAFRAKGLNPGLYYSMFDATQGIAEPASITRAKIDLAKTQLRELLTNYGEIPVLFIDGWAWKMGHLAIAYQEIHELVKSLQPNCLLADNTHVASPWNADIVTFEEPQGVFAPAGNTYPAHQAQKINNSGGNDWFWAPTIGNLMTVTSIVDDHLKRLEPLWTNFLLNCPPNRDGLMDATIVTRLAEVGAAWSANTARPPLPAQGPQIERPYTAVAATATSGTAGNAIDGLNDNNFNTLWTTSGAFPQSITLDLGQSRPDVGIVSVTPRYMNNRGVADGNITSYRVLLSTDGATFTEAAAGTWTADAKLKVVTFTPTAARYVRVEARAANGTAAIATELSVGGS